MKRVKKIPRAEFECIFEQNWKPMVLEGEALPNFARGIPEATRHCFIASGEIRGDGPYSSDLIIGGRLVGGIDIYRHSPDDPVKFNKDWYAVVACDDSCAVLFVDGPRKDTEHWLNEIPERYSGAEIIGDAIKST